MSSCLRTWFLHHSTWNYQHWEEAFWRRSAWREFGHTVSRVLPDPRHRMTTLSCLKELRDRSRFSTAHSRDPNHVFLQQRSTDRCVLHNRCQEGGIQHPQVCRFPPHSEPTFQFRHICCSQTPMILAKIVCVSSTAATDAVDVASLTTWTLLSMFFTRHFRQSADLRPFLPQSDDNRFNLAWVCLSGWTFFALQSSLACLSRNWYGHPLVGLLWERQFGKALVEEFLVVLKKHKLFFSVHLRMTSKWPERGRI